jgi:DNA-binding CsgD family transcriptional regulator
MRVPASNRRFEIQEMWERHHQICRLAVLGLKQKAIAEALGITEQTVSNTLNSTIVKRHLNVLRDTADLAAVDVAAEIRALAPLATRRLKEVLENDDADTKVQVGVAQDILDRAGHSAIRKVQSENLHAHLSLEEIEEIKARARELAASNGITARKDDDDRKVVDVIAQDNGPTS